jgi:acyl-CoA synthetase (AMP-forming)/AMP-acid ligase II
MIKTGVENVYPAEVEACLKQHPGVAEVCIIGVPDPTWDQNVKAIIVAKPDVAFTAQDYIDHCKDRLASYKKPKIVVFADALIKDGAGALDRKAMDDAYGGGGYPKAG